MCIRDSSRSARQGLSRDSEQAMVAARQGTRSRKCAQLSGCLLYTSDAADERSSVDLGGRRIIKKKNRSEPE